MWGSGRHEGRADWFCKNTVFSEEYHIMLCRMECCMLIRPFQNSYTPQIGKDLITHPSDNNLGQDHFSACHLLILCLLLQSQTKEILIWEKLIKYGTNLQQTIMLPSNFIHSQQHNSLSTTRNGGIGHLLMHNYNRIWTQ